MRTHSPITHFQPPPGPSKGYSPLAQAPRKVKYTLPALPAPSVVEGSGPVPSGVEGVELIEGLAQKTLPAVIPVPPASPDSRPALGFAARRASRGGPFKPAATPDNIPTSLLTKKFKSAIIETFADPPFGPASPPARTGAGVVSLASLRSRSRPLADVAELADAQASGACGIKPVEVRLLSSAIVLFYPSPCPCDLTLPPS